LIKKNTKNSWLTVKIWAFLFEDIMHGANYRAGTGQPFTRKKYIKGKPQIKIAKFQGGKRGVYEFCVQLLVNEKVQIRHMAIESCRLAANKTLEKTTGESGYYSRLRIYPHNLLRENKMIAAAGADRLQEGMRRAWGKAVSLGARVKQGQCIMEFYVNGPHVDAAKNALKGACVKLPATPTIQVKEFGKMSP
jgi:large subunit ribosomal protein L10e